MSNPKSKQLINNYPKLKIHLMTWFKTSETIYLLSDFKTKQNGKMATWPMQAQLNLQLSIHANFKEAYACAKREPCQLQTMKANAQ